MTIQPATTPKSIYTNWVFGLLYGIAMSVLYVVVAMQVVPQVPDTIVYAQGASVMLLLAMLAWHFPVFMAVCWVGIIFSMPMMAGVTINTSTAEIVGGLIYTAFVFLIPLMLKLKPWQEKAPALNDN